MLGGALLGLPPLLGKYFWIASLLRKAMEAMTAAPPRAPPTPAPILVPFEPPPPPPPAAAVGLEVAVAVLEGVLLTPSGPRPAPELPPLEPDGVGVTTSVVWEATTVVRELLVDAGAEDRVKEGDALVADADVGFGRLEAADEAEVVHGCVFTKSDLR